MDMKSNGTQSSLNIAQKRTDGRFPVDLHSDSIQELETVIYSKTNETVNSVLRILRAAATCQFTSKRNDLITSRQTNMEARKVKCDDHYNIKYAVIRVVRGNFLFVVTRKLD